MDGLVQAKRFTPPTRPVKLFSTSSQPSSPVPVQTCSSMLDARACENPSGRIVRRRLLMSPKVRFGYRTGCCQRDATQSQTDGSVQSRRFPHVVRSPICPQWRVCESSCTLLSTISMGSLASFGSARAARIQNFRLVRFLSTVLFS